MLGGLKLPIENNLKTRWRSLVRNSMKIEDQRGTTTVTLMMMVVEDAARR